MRDEGLLEREREIAQLERALDEAAEGRGRVVAVRGPAGIGKTRLVGAVIDRASSRDHAVAAARGGELEREFAFGVVRQLFEAELAQRDAGGRGRALSGAAALAEPVLAHAPRPASRGPGAGFAAIHGLYWLTANLAAEQPLVLVVDDAQWIDAASLRWLQYLARRIDGHPVLVVLALRPGDSDPASDVLDAVVAEVDVEVIELGPLTEQAVAGIVDGRIGRSADPAIRRACLEVSGGNPFLLEELLRSLEGDQRITSESIRRAAPSTIARRVHTRLERLDRQVPGAAALAAVASVLGTGARLATAAAVGSLSIEEAADAVDRLVMADILATADPIEFIHPLVWSVVYHEIPQARRALLHARAAEILAADPASEDQTAAHLLRAPPQRDDGVVDALSDAAASAVARGAPEVAVAYLRRALAEPPSAPRRGGLLRELGTAEQLVQDPQAVAHLDEALELEDDPHGRATSARLLANVLVVQADIPGGMRALERALATVPAEDRELRLTLEADRWLGWLLPGVGDEFVDQLQGVLGAPVHGAETPAERLVLAAMAIVGVMRGLPVEEVIENADRALGEDALLTQLTGESATWIACVSALWISDQIDRAAALVTVGIDDARTRGSLFGYAHASAFHGMCAWRMGDLTSAEADGRSALDAPGHLPLEVVSVAMTPLICALTDRGRFDAADAVLSERGLRDHAPPGHHPIWLLEARGRLRHAQGDLLRARRDFEEVGRRCAVMGTLNPAVVPWRSCLALVLLAQGDREVALQTVGEELTLARAFGAPRAIGLALRAEGLVRGGDDAVALLEESAQALRASESALDLARTLVDLGGALRRSGRRADARSPLAEALAIAHRCEADHVANAADAELRAAGARPRRRVLTGVDSLTPSERRIASLAVRGLANREIAQSLFLTVKTVEMHLGNTYRKLDIGSRGELAVALGEGPDPGGPPALARAS